MSSPKRLLHSGFIGVAVLVTISVAAGIWAGRTVLTPPVDPFTAESPALYRVVEGDIGRTLPTTVLAQWDLVVAAVAPTDGVVTTVETSPGDILDVGDAIATVDLRPVILAEGDIPAFRMMAPGDGGEDVAQLQLLLQTLGFDAPSHGRYDDATMAAVAAWQQTLGLEPDGIVRLGDVAFAERLPITGTIAPGIERAARVASGSPILLSAVDTPRWWMLLTDEQTRQIGIGTRVSVRIDGATVSGHVTAVVEDREQGRFEAEIARLDGTSICAATCVESVPLDSEIHVYPASIELIEQRSGPVVPVAALSSSAAGEAVLIMEDGSARRVEVVASSSGLAIVDGIEIGELIRLPFGEQP